MVILVLNCRNRSIKYRLFDWEQKRILADGSIDGLDTGDMVITHIAAGLPPQQLSSFYLGYRDAIEKVLKLLTDPETGSVDGLQKIDAVGHRVVHGGECFAHSVLIDDSVTRAIREVETLAPEYNGPNLWGIEAARELLPEIPHVAIFDTSFHHSIPKHAHIYPLPMAWYEKYGVRRYGFHGTSHLYLSKRAAALLGKRACDCNLITIHLDLGISLCAIKNGLSYDTSMGMTPIEGVMMERRCGDIDPGILPLVMEMEGLASRAMKEVLSQRSGLLGITETWGSRREVLKGAMAGDPRCVLAAEMEEYRLKKYIGSYCCATGRPDAIVFTTGQGSLEAAVREKALRNMDIFGIDLDAARNRSPQAEMSETIISSDDSAVKVFVVPTHEDLVFVEDVAGIVNGAFADHLDFDYSFTRSDFGDYPGGWMKDFSVKRLPNMGGF